MFDYDVEWYYFRDLIDGVFWVCFWALFHFGPRASYFLEQDRESEE